MGWCLYVYIDKAAIVLPLVTSCPEAESVLSCDSRRGSQTFNDNLTESSGLHTQNKIKFDGKVSLKIELIVVSQKMFCFWDVVYARHLLVVRYFVVYHAGVR